VSVDGNPFARQNYVDQLIETLLETIEVLNYKPLVQADIDRVLQEIQRREQERQEKMGVTKVGYGLPQVLGKFGK